MISEAKLAANRRNAVKGGVKTREGKLKSRRNSLKHGQRAEVVLPEDVQGEIEAKFAKIVDEIRPEGTVETGLARRMATELVKLERIEKEEHAALAARIREAGEAFEEEQERRVEACMQLLAKQPARAVRGMLAFTAGCNWLLDQWGTLRGAQEAGAWGPKEEKLAWHLLGGQDLGPDRAMAITEEVAAVESERDAIWEELDGPLWQEAEDRALLDTSKAGQLRSRYEGQAARQLHKAIDQYCKLRNVPAEPRRRPRARPAPNEPTAEVESQHQVPTTEPATGATGSAANPCPKRPATRHGFGAEPVAPAPNEPTTEVQSQSQVPTTETMRGATGSAANPCPGRAASGHGFAAETVEPTGSLEGDPHPGPLPGGEGGRAPNEPTAEVETATKVATGIGRLRAALRGLAPGRG